MKTIHILYLLSLFFLIHFQVKGQQTEYFENIQKEIKVAKELFDNGKYIAAFIEFEKVQQNADKKSAHYTEAEYYKSVSALKAGYDSGSKLIKNFVEPILFGQV